LTDMVIEVSSPADVKCYANTGIITCLFLHIMKV
jgi:hypothetical protein